MTDKHWKAAERRAAKLLPGGRRNAVTGERAGADVESIHAVVQVKRGYDLPGYLREWLDGITAWRNLHEPLKAACVFWQQKRGRDDETLVILSLRDFSALLQGFPTERKDVQDGVRGQADL